MKVLFLSLGTKEAEVFFKTVNGFQDMLEKQGIDYTFYSSPKPGTNGKPGEGLYINMLHCYLMTTKIVQHYDF